MATQHAGRTPVPDDSFGALTPREQEVADLISQGLSNEAIAQQLTLARGTVANHVAHILAKTAARSRVQVAVKLVRPRPSRRADDVLALLTRLQALGLPTCPVRCSTPTRCSPRSSTPMRATRSWPIPPRRSWSLWRAVARRWLTASVHSASSISLCRTADA